MRFVVAFALPVLGRCGDQQGAQAQAFVTTKDRSMSLKPTDAPVRRALQNADWKLSVDDTSGKRQEITGFGATWTDGSTYVLDKLPSDKQIEVMNDLFTSQGIDLGLMRHTIGQSDITPQGKYSYDDSDQVDSSLSHWDLKDPGRSMVKWLKKMLDLKPSVTIFGSVWSPPQWMKHDNTIDWPRADDWVNYFVKYVQTYRDEGVKVDAVTIQNEPLMSKDPAWTTRIDSSYAVILTNKLKPALRNAGLRTQIWAYDHNADNDGWNYVQDVVSHAGQNVDAVAWHCYATDYWVNVDNWHMLSDFHSGKPNIPQYMTECWDHLKDEDFFNLPDFIQGPLMHWASGSMAFSLAGSTNYDVGYPGPGTCGQCSGLVQVDMNSGTYQLTQDYYNLGQFSKFVKRDAKYLANSGGFTYPDSTGVQFTSFLNPDGSRVLVIVNKIRNDLHTEVKFSSGAVWNGWIKRESVTTWVLEPSSSEQSPPPLSQFASSLEMIDRISDDGADVLVEVVEALEAHYV